MTVSQYFVEMRTNKTRGILPIFGAHIGQYTVAKEAAHQHGVLGVNKNGQARHELAQFRPDGHGNFHDPISEWLRNLSS